VLIWKTALSLNWRTSLVSPSSAPAAAANVERLVLTGATGFIGSAVLVALVNAGLVDRVRCLVRARDRAHGLERLRAAALRGGLAPYWVERLTEANVIVGELGGVLSANDHAQLRAASHVINCAGLTTLSPKTAEAAAHVDDSLRFAERFAGSARLQRFLHVSAAFVSDGDGSGTVFEHDDAGADGAELTPYAGSKRKVEERLRGLDLPLVLARPSSVVGHTMLGTQPSSSTFWMFRIIHAARRFTARPMTRVDVISVDDCARALMLLAVKPALAHDLYHVSVGDEAPTVTQIVRAMDEAEGMEGVPRYALCGSAEFPLIARGLIGRRDRARERLVEQALHLYAGYAELDHIFDNGRARDEIDFEPLPFVDYVNECMRTSRGIGVLDQMRADLP
jgi:nucleoside-diphosphate-sugar epimerase